MVALTLSVATFNVLAPCYRRLAWSAVATEEGVRREGRRPRESEFLGLWRSRCADMCEFLRRDDSFDILCLQEFWFEKEYAEKVYKNFDSEYEMISLQRTGGKPDGVLTMVRRGKLELEHVEELLFHDKGDRVALLTALRMVDMDAPLVVVNTHLTFPHNDYDRLIRQEQITNLTEFIDGFLDRHGMEHVPVMIVGDMNGDISDPVSAHLRAHCYENSFVDVTGIENVITHLNHRNEQVFADHVWYRKHLLTKLGSDASLVARTSLVVPQTKAVQNWVHDFEISDHRLLSVTYTVEPDVEIKTSTCDSSSDVQSV